MTQPHTHSGRANLLVRLHFASHHSEGVVDGVVVDLDPAEGLGPRPRREPLLVAVVVDHHRGPSLADTRLTGGGRDRGRVSVPFYFTSRFSDLCF